MLQPVPVGHSELLSFPFPGFFFPGILCNPWLPERGGSCAKAWPRARFWEKKGGLGLCPSFPGILDPEQLRQGLEQGTGSCHIPREGNHGAGAGKGTGFRSRHPMEEPPGNGKGPDPALLGAEIPGHGVRRQREAVGGGSGMERDNLGWGGKNREFVRAWSHRIMEWFGWEGALNPIPFQP